MRSMLLLVVLLVASSAFPDAEEPAQDPLTVFGGIQLCGPAEEAIDFVHPRPHDIDKGGIRIWEEARKKIKKKAKKKAKSGPHGSRVLEFSTDKVQVSEKILTSSVFLGQRPVAVLLTNQNGVVHSAALVYKHGDARHLYNEINAAIESRKGASATIDGKFHLWIEDEMVTTTKWIYKAGPRNPDIVLVTISCRELIEEAEVRGAVPAREIF